MIKDIPSLINKVIYEIKKITDVAVIGLSGGADSTLVALLCKEALGKENVYGIHMPYSQYDKVFFNDRSTKLAEKLDIKDYYISIEKIAGALTQTLKEIFEGEEISKVNMGNGFARTRMCLLYGVGMHLEGKLKKRVRVVGTGNLSEIVIGYETKYGDGGCDFAPIGDLFKSEVYQLLEYFRNRGDITEEMIDRKPAAGLWGGQSDAEELGYTYDEMEPSIRKLRTDDGNILWEYTGIKDMDSYTEIDKFIHKKYTVNKHKHTVPPIVKLRKDFCD